MGINTSGLAIIQGFLISFRKSQTLVNCPTSGIYGIKWYGNILPPGVKVGSRITVAGKLVTFDLGRGFILINAVVLKSETVKKVKKLIEEQII